MSEPYYSDDLVTLYHGDCREVTAWLEADVLATDPPYGMAYTSNRHTGRGHSPILVAGDEDTQVRDAALALWGDVRPSLVFGTWKRPRPDATRQVLIWDKTTSNGFGAEIWSPWGPTFEEIYVLGSWGGNQSPPGIVVDGKKREPAVISVPNYNTQASSRPDHPTPKPVALMERLIRRTAGTVADPFAGSGSTLVAAKHLGRKTIGIELDERYCEIAARRLAQDTLFGASV